MEHVQVIVFRRKLSRCIGGFILCCLASCAQVPKSQSAHNAQPVNVSTCPEFDGSDEVARLSGVVFVGENHGTNEIPWYFGAIVCHATKFHSSVHVALELPEDWTLRIDEFINADQESAAITKFFGSPEWKKRVAFSPDGLTSKAMAALIMRLRELRQSGRTVFLSTFDTRAWEAPAVNSDVGMAAMLTRNIEKFGADVTFILSGEYHTRLLENNAAKPQSMARLVSAARPSWKTSAITVSFSAGSLWGCRSLTDCGELSQPTKIPLSKPRFVMATEKNRLGYSGDLYVGAISPSPPFIYSPR